MQRCKCCEMSEGEDMVCADKEKRVVHGESE